MRIRNEYIAPTLVLMTICLIVALALTLTFEVTKPIIATNTKAYADAARSEVLPSGSGSFTLIDQETLDGIADIYIADNKSGVVITSIEKGFGGKIIVMVGIDKEGDIQGIKILEHTETPGLGTKAMTKNHLSQYLGQSKITNTRASDATKIDAITGATISSNAIYRAAEDSLRQFAELGGVINE